MVRSRSLRRHHGDNILKDQECCERLRALPLKAMECDRSKLRQNYESIAAHLWFLAKVRETGWFGGFAIFSRTRAGRRGRAIIEEKPPHSPRPGCHLYGITNLGQEPKVCRFAMKGLPLGL